MMAARTQAEVAAQNRQRTARQAMLPPCPITGAECARDCDDDCEWGAEPLADGYPCASPARPFLEALYRSDGEA